MASKLNNPDMPTMAYKYDIRIIGDVPQVVWETGKAMDALYTDLVERHEAFCGAFKDAGKETRKKTFAQLMRNGKGGVLYERTKASKDTLDFRYYWTVWDRFRKAQRRFASGQGGAPKAKHCLERVLFPMEFGNFSEPVDWIHSNQDNRCYVRTELVELDEWRALAHKVFDPLWNSGNRDGISTRRTEAYEWLARAMELSSAEAHISKFDIEQCRRSIELVAAKRGLAGIPDRRRRGHFTVDDTIVPFEIVMDRPLPEGALIKGIALSGFHERPFD